MKIKSKTLTTTMKIHVYRQDIDKMLVDNGILPEEWMYYSVVLKVVGEWNNELEITLEKTNNETQE